MALRSNAVVLILAAENALIVRVAVAVFAAPA
jgi:hypothetical protein